MKLVKKRYFFAVMVFAFLGFTIKDEETKVITIPPTFVVDVPQMATAMPAEATANSELLPTSFTESGILAAAHLAGESSVKKFFKHQGGYNFADGNGVTLQHYLKAFAGYDTSHIEAVQKPQWEAPETTSLSSATL